MKPSDESGVKSVIACFQDIATKFELETPKNGNEFEITSIVGQLQDRFIGRSVLLYIGAEKSDVVPKTKNALKELSMNSTTDRISELT